MPGSKSYLDLAGAKAQGGTAGQQRSAQHALRAADDGQGTERSLVNIARGPTQDIGQRRGERRPHEAMAACRVGIGGDAQTVDTHLAAEIRSARRQQPGFQPQKGERGFGPDGGGRGDTRIGIEAGGNVGGEKRRAAGVGPFDQLRIGFGQRPRDADAEQRVDDQRRNASRRFGDRAAARCKPGFMCSSGVPGQLVCIAAKHHFHRMKHLTQRERCYKTVAAIVAGSGQHDDATAMVTGERCPKRGQRAARARHQRCARCRGFQCSKLAMR